MAGRDPAADGGVKLGRIEPFRLGQVEVVPTTRQMIKGDRSETIEPRVMQVLVALAEANGAVVSREELFQRCWDGRIVGEDAMNRVISRIRHLAADVGTGSFEIETITKVGYRLVVRRDAVAECPQPSVVRVEPPSLGRRSVLGGGIAGALLAAGGLLVWKRRSASAPIPEAIAFYERGQTAQREGGSEQLRQAVSYFRWSTQAAPSFAEGWGALALACAELLETHGAEGKEGLPSNIASAARRALTLDPDNVDAQLALTLVNFGFGRWRKLEAELLRLSERHPDNAFVQAHLAKTFYGLGRWRDGLHHTERQLAIDPWIPGAHIHRARALWSAGRLQEAEALLDSAVDRWPAHYDLWNFRFGFLLLSGRAQSAAAYALDPEKRPEGLRPDSVESRVIIARAAERRGREDVAAALEWLRAVVAERLPNILQVAPLLLLFGAIDEVQDGLDRLYLAHGGGGAPPLASGQYERRHTLFLFTPDMQTLWQTRRFAYLLDHLGLEDYWSQSGIQPDFRRSKG